MHEQWQDMLIHYVNGTLSRAECQALETHLAGCPECRAAMNDWRILAQTAAVEINLFKDDLPPLALPFRTRYVPPGSNSPHDRKPDSWEDNDMFFNTMLGLAVQPRRRTMPLALIATVAITVLISAILIFNPGSAPYPIFSGWFSRQEAETPSMFFERYIDEVWNSGNIDTVGDMLAPEFTHYDAALSEPITNLDALKAYIEGFRNRLPGVTFSIDEIIEKDGMISAYLTASNDQFTLPLTANARLVDGKFTEFWFDANALVETRQSQLEQQNAEVERNAFEEVFINRNTDTGLEYVKQGAIWCAGAKPANCGPMTVSFRKEWVESLFIAFPDLEFTVQQIVPDGDTVLIEVLGNGTFSHAFVEPMSGKTVQPTNKQETWSWLRIETFEDGKLIKERWYWYWYNWPVTPLVPK